MKILQINNYHYLKGGSEKVYFETSELLKRKRHEVIYFSVKEEETFETPYSKYFVEPIQYKDVSFFTKLKNVTKFIYSKESKQKLEKLIIEEKPDIAHLHIFYGRLTSSILPVLKKYNIPTVMTVHEYRMLCPVYVMLDSKGKICEKCTNGNYFHCIINKCNKGDIFNSTVSALDCFIRDKFFPYEEYIDKFIMVSKFIMNKHLEYKPQLKNKVVQIYNFVNTNFNEKELKISHQNYYLYFGRLSREKGVLTLLETWKNFPNLKLKIVGTGELEKEVKTFVSNNKMDNVKILGYKTGEELENLVKNAKFVIVPSEWYENNPMNIIESFSYGKPVIGAKIGGIPELVLDNKTGFLFESKNVKSLVESINKAENLTDSEYLNLSKNAYEFAKENFNSEIYYKNLISVYKEVLSERK